MKSRNLIIIITFMLSFVKATTAQTSDTEKLLCREWTIVSMVENGEVTNIPPSERKDKMIFTNDHKVKMIETGHTETLNWSYDAATKTLTITDPKAGEPLPFQVIKISATECTLEIRNESDAFRINMIADK